MLYASTYYGISGLGDDTLAHHGIKGQKWGVRRFQNADGTYTQAGRNRYFTDDGNLSKKGERAYRKDLKKLNKLKARADISQQKKNIEKYEKRADTAKKVGIAAGAVAAGAAVGKVPIYGRRSQIHRLADIADNRLDTLGKINRAHGYKELYRIATRENWAKYPEATDRRLALMQRQFNAKALDARHRYENTVAPLKKELNVLKKANTVRKGVAIASTGVAVGAGATYVYSKIQANAARKRISDIGHEKAVADVNRQIEHMKQTYGNVKLSDLDKTKR